MLPRDRWFLSRVKEITEEGLSDREFNVTVLCTRLGISRVSLHRKIKRITGQSASEFIRNMRLDHAVELMHTGEFNISEAARRSGFQNLSYFSRCFRDKFRCLPSEFFSEHSNANNNSKTGHANWYVAP